MAVRVWLGAGLVLIVSVVAGVFIFNSRVQSAHAVALDVLAGCSTEADKSACYERSVPALLNSHTVREVFNVIREIRRQDRGYQFCHVLAHKLGERVVAEDPEAWIDAIPLNPPDGLCSNGFIHGVVGGRFRSEVLDDATIEKFVPDFRKACEPRASWSPSDLDRAICYHGLGHLYDFVTDADIPKAVSVCDATVPQEMLRVCVEGVFMQIYQPLEPDDFLMIERMSVKPSTTTVRSYCARFPDDTHEGACLRESWPYFTAEIMSGEGVGRFCAGQPNAEEERKCYESMSAIIGRLSLSDVDRAVSACGRFPEEFQKGCFTGSAQAVLEEERADGTSALAVCDKAPDVIAMQCKEELARRAKFIYGDNRAQQERFCALMPDRLQTYCR